MAYNEFKLTRTTPSQLKGVQESYYYETDLETIDQVLAAGYFTGFPCSDDCETIVTVNASDGWAMIHPNGDGGESEIVELLSLNPEQQKTLSHFKFNPETDKLEADRPIETTLNSFFLGDVHKISSGGENVFFTNLNSNVDYFPMWGGVKDQEVPENQDATGIITPSARVYSNNLLTLEIYGPAAASGSVPYARASAIIADQSLYGQRTIVEETILETDYLFYEVYAGTDESGILAYEQSITGESLSPGDSLTWWFDHPVEGQEGTFIYSTMKKASSQDGERTVLNVRESSVIPGAHYVDIYFRFFEDKDLEYISPFLYQTSMDFSVDATGTTVILSDQSTGDALINYPVNTIKAVQEDVGIRVILDDGDKIYINQLDIAQTYIDGTLVTQTLATAVNELNALFQNTGTSAGEVPNITSSLAISLVEGQTLNYELTDDYGTEYEWDTSAVSGVVVTSDNRRKIIGGSGLAAGTYNIPVKAINYNGEDSETIVLTVSTPPFANTKSIQFNNLDYLGANAALLDGILGRSGNGSGSGDAWTIAFWFKPTTNTSGQTVFYFGDNDITNSGHINVRFLGANDNLRLQYGSNNNFIRFQSATSSLTPNQWQHIVISYDGGTTGASSSDMADYYSRFKVFIDGSNVISAGTWSHNNFGYTGGIDADNLRVGRYASGNYLKDNTKVDELAIWGSDQSANISDIYNSGTPFDLSTLTTGPNHWWRMGDGDTYPNLQDSGSAANCVFVMYNMTSSDIVSDVP